MSLLHFTERQAHVLILDACGLCPQEICQRLKIPRGSFNSILKRAKNNCRKFGLIINGGVKHTKLGAQAIRLQRKNELKETGFEAAKRLAIEAGLVQI